MFAFGKGYDLIVDDGCHKTDGSYSNFGNSYDIDPFVSGFFDSNSYLAGTYRFFVKEIEVFQINLDDTPK